MAASQRERQRALARRLERTGAELTRKFRDALTLAASALAREAARDAGRRRERLAAAAQRWGTTLRAEGRRGRERAGRLPVIEGRLRKGFGDALLRRRVRFDAVAQLFGAVNYHGVLARGFALVRDERDAPIKRVSEISPPQPIKIQFADGEIAATAGGPGAVRRARRKTVDDDQSTLF